MNKPDLSVSVANSGLASGSANSSMAQQAISFIEDYLNPRPTIVMIAHRDQSLAYCDRVLRFENGSFVGDESPVTV